MPERVGFQGIRTLSWRMTKTQTIWLAGGINVDSLSFFYPETIISANSLRGSGLWINYNPNRVPSPKWFFDDKHGIIALVGERKTNVSLNKLIVHGWTLIKNFTHALNSWLLSVLFINLYATIISFEFYFYLCYIHWIFRY